jgi:hypothetical protein
MKSNAIALFLLCLLLLGSFIVSMCEFALIEPSNTMAGTGWLIAFCITWIPVVSVCNEFDRKPRKRKVKK